MKFIFLTIVSLLFHLQLAAQPEELTGVYELRDTLSKQKIEMGDSYVIKVKMLVKELYLNTDQSFELKHIEPKGFAINADKTGTWSFENNKILLKYKDIIVDEKGIKSEKEIIDEYVLFDGKLIFQKSETQTWVFKPKLEETD